MTAPKLPDNLADNFYRPQKYRRLSVKKKIAAIHSVEEGRESVSLVCARLGVSRTIFYRWRLKYLVAKAQKLRDPKASIHAYLSPKVKTFDPSQRHPLSLGTHFNQEITEILKRAPSLSSHKLAKEMNLSEAGVRKILRRLNLSRYENRKGFQRAHLLFRPWLILTFFLEYLLGGFLLPEVPVFGFFLSLTPRAKKFRAFLFFFLLFATLSLLFYKINRILFATYITGGERVGLVLSEIALAFGIFFFLYSLKYYSTIVLVLWSSRSVGGNGKEHAGVAPSAGNAPNDNGASSPASAAIRQFLHSPNGNRHLNGNGGIFRRFLRLGNGFHNGNGYGSNGSNGYGNGFLNGFKNGINGFKNGNGLNGFPASGWSASGGKNGPTPGVGNGTLTPGVGGRGNLPKVSIHLPFYNEKRVAERILEACKNLTYPNLEVIVIDDSDDGTTDIIGKWGKRYGKWKRINEKGQDPEVWKLEISNISNHSNHSNDSNGNPKSLPPYTLNPRPYTLKLIKRYSRAGFKGGALREALKFTVQSAEYIVVFDADFIPFPDTLEQFLSHFHYLCGGLQYVKKSRIAAIQGYQWHILNKDENWITQGIRTEYAGSYVVERAGTELTGALKQIAGSVYMIRKDVLEQFGWQDSITEDFQLTLRLYAQGYKVIYTPYIQTPAEAPSTIKRLVRQRMRWAEGHTHQVKQKFSEVFFAPRLYFSEKLEFLYLSPYYLQAFFFALGTLSWFTAEIVFKTPLPFWTSSFGWALVITNLLSLPFMNAVGLFLEEAEKRDYQGLFSFIANTYILVPFQAYAALKGLLEKKEGYWFRTPKTGLITISVARAHFARLLRIFLPGRYRPATGDLKVAVGGRKGDFGGGGFLQLPASNPYLSLATANNRFDSFKIKKKRISWVGKIALALVLTLSLLVNSMAFTAKPVEATWYSDANYLYRKQLTIDETLVSGSANHSNFPILVSYTDASLKTTANGGRVTNSSGFDIIFTDDDKTTKLDHEIEKYTATTGEIVMWVRIPTLPYNVDKDIYIYYGNSSISTSQENITGVWDADYMAVWHLDEDAAGTGNIDLYKDSTSNANHADDYVSATGKTGQIDGGQQFDGTDDYAQAPTSTSLDITGNQITIEAWVRLTSTFNSSSPNDMTIIDGGGKIEYWFDAGTGKVSFSLNTGGWLALLSTQASWTGNTWYHLVGVYNGTNRFFYVGGSQDNSSSDTGNLAASTFGIRISQDPPHPANEGTLDGEIDEVRISDVGRSADWVATEHNNQANQGTGSGKFIKTLGAEEQVPELVVLLLPVALVVPFLVRRLRRRGRLGFVSLDVSGRWPISEKTIGFRKRRWIRGP